MKKADGGSRTRNLRFTKPVGKIRNPLQPQQVTNPADSVGTPWGQTTHNPAHSIAIADKNLQAVIDAWPTLPEAIRAGIAAMVAAAKVRA